LASHSAPAQEINLAYLIARLWRASFGVALFVIVITGLTYVFTQISDPKYRSDAQLLIEPQETAFTRPDAESGQNTPTIDERDILSAVQVMRSRDVGMDVIERLNLGDNPLFDSARDGIGTIKSMMILFGLSEDPMLLSVDERVYQSYVDGLKVFNVPGSRVVVVAYESPDPELSASIANAVVASYQATQRATQATNTRSASSFLETEIAELRQQVAEAEAAVARFRAGSGLFLGPNQTTLSAQQLSEVSTELTRARAAESEARSRAQELRNLISIQGTALALPDSFSTPLTRRLQEEQATLRARIAELGATLLPAHPRIQELNAQLSDLGSQIRAEASRVAQRFDNEARVASARAQALEDQLAGLTAQAARTSESEVELRALEREAAAQRDLLASYLVRFREAATREDTDLLPTNARVIQTAQVERDPVFPKTLPMIIIAMVGSLVLALLGVISHAILAGAVREDDGQVYRQDPSIRQEEPPPETNSQLSQGMAAGAATTTGRQTDRIRNAVAPTSRLESRQTQQPQAIATQITAGPATMAPDVVPVPESTMASYSLGDPSDCRRLFAHLRRVGPQEGGTRITVGAADGSVVAGDIALNLARAMAQAGRSTLMMDCVGDLLGRDICPDGPGFYELVTGTAGFDTALHRDPQSQLHLVPSGFVQADRSMIADDAADLIMSALASNYDAVIVNAGRDPQLMLECAMINDCMVLSGDAGRVAALGHTLSSIVSRNQLIAVRAGHTADTAIAG
jgi:uncharacterized protein involved in exopolysaccharide biosynthesis/Mrp family chromosome partitioning ATPase